MIHVSKQLRLNNLVKGVTKFSGRKAIFRVEELNYDDVIGYCYHVGSTEIFENVEGIEITPNILTGLGFFYWTGGASGCDEWQGFGVWKRVKGMPHQEFYFRGHYSSTKPLVLKLVGWINSEIKYVHQIQNLYLDLCGEELEIELKQVV